MATTGALCSMPCASKIAIFLQVLLVATAVMANATMAAAGPQSGPAQAVGSAAAQSPALDSPDTKIRISVDLAQTDVVVTDRAGRPVRDLEVGAFELFDNGRLQKITNFSWVDVVSAAPGRRPAAVRDAKSGVAPAAVLRREDFRRALVLMVDDAGTNTADHASLIPALHSFVTDQIQPGDLAAVTASRGGMAFYDRLTSDKNQLNAAIDQIGHRPGWLSCDYIPPYVSANNARFFHYVPGDFILSNNFCQPADKNGTLRRVIEGLSVIPGRKAVVLVSHSFGASPANVGLANRAGVVIYVLDPGGGEPAKVRAPGPGGVEGSSLLATETGGFRRLTVPREIGKDLGDVLDDMSGYYVLGYHTMRIGSEAQVHAAEHTIRVRVLREGLIVRARSTPGGFGDAALRPAPHTRAEYLQQALLSPFSSGGLQVSVQPAYTASGRDPKTGRRGIDLRMHMTVENAVETNLTSLTLDTLVAVLRSDGTTSTGGAKTVNLSEITPEQAAQFRVSGVRFSMQLGVKGAGDYQIRVAVRDPASGKSGSAYTFLAIPNFDKGALTLATPVLGPSTWNEFAAGEIAQFSCQLFGSSAAKARGEIRLFSETGPLGSPRSLSHKSNNGSNFLEGDMPLPGGLPPGEYGIRLVAWDGAAGPAKPTGYYWSKLRIVSRESSSAH